VAALLDWAKAWAQTAPWIPEEVRSSHLQWKYFVQAEDEAFVMSEDSKSADYIGSKRCLRF